MKKKLYCYTTAIALGIINIMVILGLLVPVILFPKETWFLIIPIFLFLIAFWYMFGTGMFFPIYLSDSGVRYRGQEYMWEDIKITAFNRQYRICYLVFGTEYLQGEDLKNAVRKGFWVYLKEKVLNEILFYYKNRIVIVDVSGEKDDNEICATNKIKETINNHNQEILLADKDYWKQDKASNKRQQ